MRWYFPEEASFKMKLKDRSMSRNDPGTGVRILVRRIFQKECAQCPR